MRRFGEDVIDDTRWSIAENTRRVNYFIGTVRMSCGKIAESPTRKYGVMQYRAKDRAPGRPNPLS